MIYEVCFYDRNTGKHERSRIFQTLAAAKKWYSWLNRQNFVSSTQIYKGGVGGDLIQTSKVCEFCTEEHKCPDHGKSLICYSGE
jgi:hypothetical protein